MQHTKINKVAPTEDDANLAVADDALQEGAPEDKGSKYARPNFRALANILH